MNDSTVSYKDPTYGAIVFCYEWEYRFLFRGGEWWIDVYGCRTTCERRPFYSLPF